MDRVRGGRQKYRRNPAANPYQLQIFQSNTNTAPTSLEDIKLLEILNVCEPDLLSIGHPHIELMYNKNLSCLADDKKPIVDDKSDIFMEHRVEADVQEMLSVLSDIYDKELVGVIGWAKQIPGFIELPLNDQMKLLQVTWAELLTLQLAYRSIPFTGKLIFAKDFWLDERTAKECGAFELYSHVSLTSNDVFQRTWRSVKY